MLWNLYDEKTAGQYFRCWGTLVKLTWDCPRSTHKYLVSRFLAPGFVSIRAKVISRYVKFFQTILKSASKEGSLAKLLDTRHSMELQLQDTKKINELINPLCSS